MLLISVLWTLQQGYHSKFWACQGYIVRPCFKEEAEEEMGEAGKEGEQHIFFGLSFIPGLCPLGAIPFICSQINSQCR